jgi:hypothetical protein
LSWSPAAAEERQLSQNSLLAYRRTWLKIIAWAADEDLVLETLPPERVEEFYEKATRGRSASHHLQVKAALQLEPDRSEVARKLTCELFMPPS